MATPPEHSTRHTCPLMRCGGPDSVRTLRHEGSPVLRNNAREWNHLLAGSPAAKQAHANFHEALESLHAGWLWHRDGDLSAKYQDKFESAKLPIKILAIQQRWKISSEALWHRKVGYGMKYIAGSIPRYLKATLAFRRQCSLYRQEQAKSIRQFAQMSLEFETYAGRHLPEEMIRYCTHRHDFTFHVRRQFTERWQSMSGRHC